MEETSGNRFEVALWVGGAALVVLSIVIAVAVSILSNEANSNSASRCDDNGCTSSFEQLLVQVLYSIYPALLIAGLITVAAALAVRAVDVNASRRAATTIPTPVVEPVTLRQAQGPVVEPVEAPAPELPRTIPASAFARPGPPQREPDQSIFMRPSE